MVLREVRFLGYRRNLDKVGSLINDGTVNQDVSRMEGVCFVYKNSSMTKVLGGSTILQQVGVMSISPTGAKQALNMYLGHVRMLFLSALCVYNRI